MSPTLDIAEPRILCLVEFCYFHDIQVFCMKCTSFVYLLFYILHQLLHTICSIQCAHNLIVFCFDFITLIANCVGPTLVQRGSCQLHVGPTWAQCALLSGLFLHLAFYSLRRPCLFDLGTTIINLRWSSDQLRGRMGIPIPERCCISSE